MQGKCFDPFTIYLVFKIVSQAYNFLIEAISPLFTGIQDGSEQHLQLLVATAGLHPVGLLQTGGWLPIKEEINLSAEHELQFYWSLGVGFGVRE